MSYAMPVYFENMPKIGKSLKADNQEYIDGNKAIEERIKAKIDSINAQGRPDESIHKAGQLTPLERLDYLVDKDSFCPMGTLYNPYDNEGATGVISGLGKIGGKWCSIVVSDYKKIAGAWVPGQAQKLRRATEMAIRFRIPMVYLINCSGVELDKQEFVCFGRTCGGTPFYKNAELEQMGLPVLVGVFGTNPAGGGYHCISPAIIISHKDSNFAVGGVGITGGMQPKGYFDKEVCQELIETTRNQKKMDPPGAVSTHYDVTGYIREVYDTEEGVIDSIKKYVGYAPAYNLDYFRVDAPKEPEFPAQDLYSILPSNRKRTYDMKDIIARLVDDGQFNEFQKEYGPEVICGLAKINGLLVGITANFSGILMKYPEYREKAIGLGGKLYRQGMIKLAEFAALCERDRLPIIWIQDTNGIDVDDLAERAECLGLGQTCIYACESADVPQLNITLRKGQGAAEYLLGGPVGNNGNAFSIGTCQTEMSVMYGETAAAAMYSRRLVKEYDAGNDIQPVVDKMNALNQHFTDTSTPEACARLGYLDEIVDLTKIRNYMIAFAEASYQNNKGYCPPHLMILPRLIKEHNDNRR